MAQPDKLQIGKTPEQKQTQNFSVKVPNPLKIREYAQKEKGTVLSETQFNTHSGYHEVFFGERTVLHACDEVINDSLEKKALITAYMQMRRGTFISDEEAQEIEIKLKKTLGDHEMISIYRGKDERGRQTITVRRNDLYVVVDLGYHNNESRKEDAVINGEYIRELKIHLMRFYGPKESREVFSHLIEAGDAKFTEALDFYASFFSAVVNAAYSVKNTQVPHREVVLQVKKAV